MAATDHYHGRDGAHSVAAMEGAVVAALGGVLASDGALRQRAESDLRGLERAPGASMGARATGRGDATRPSARLPGTFAHAKRRTNRRMRPRTAVGPSLRRRPWADARTRRLGRHGPRRPPEYAPALCRIVLAAELALPMRLMAAMVLKAFARAHWAPDGGDDDDDSDAHAPPAFVVDDAVRQRARRRCRQRSAATPLIHARPSIRVAGPGPDQARGAPVAGAGSARRRATRSLGCGVCRTHPSAQPASRSRGASVHAVCARGAGRPTPLPKWP